MHQVHEGRKQDARVSPALLRALRKQTAMTKDDPLPQIPVTLTELETEDRLAIHGAYTDAKKRRIGVLFLHGLGSNLHKTRHLWQQLAEDGTRDGVGVLALNTRGHDIAARYRVRKKQGKRRSRKYRMGGAGFERFEDCIYDIRAGIRFLRSKGYKKIVLYGHSTGANKSVYYAGKTQDRRISGIILAGPARDLTMVDWNSEHRKRLKAIASFGKKDGKDTPLPHHIAGGIFSARRYESLFRPGTAEDVFPFGEPKARWARIAQVKPHLFIAFGEDDPYISDPGPEAALAILNEKAKRAKSVAGDVLPGQEHSFREDPEELSRTLIDWMQTTIV